MIRGVTEGDLPAVLYLMHALCQQEGDPQHDTAADLRRVFLSEVPQGWLVVAEDQGVIAGYGTAHLTYESGHAQRGAYVGDLFVTERYRRQGWGRRLLGGLATRVRASGGTFLWWTALPGNVAAHAFYRRLGATGEPLMAFATTGAAFEALAHE